MNTLEELSKGLKKLMLPLMRESFFQRAEFARKDAWGYEEYLLELVQNELAARDAKRFDKWMKESNLPAAKSLENFEFDRLPKGLQHQFNALRDGKFIENKENVLLFGTPGSGKTHLMCGLAQEMIRMGFRAYTPLSGIWKKILRIDPKND